MAWIESHQALGHHPKTLRLARELGCNVPCAVGYLHFLWWWALEYATDGLIAADSKPVIARACMWSGKAERFWAALIVAGFVEPAETPQQLRIHDWLDYAGKLAEQRALRRESNRKAQSARRQRLRHDDVSADVKTRQQSTVPDRTGNHLPVSQSVGSVVRAHARTRGDGGLAPLSSSLNAALPEEVRRRLAQPPIHVAGDQPTDRPTV